MARHELGLEEALSYDAGDDDDEQDEDDDDESIKYRPT